MKIYRMNTADAGKYLGIASGTLEVWRCKGRGPRYRKIGSKVRYDLVDLEEFANARIIETTDSMEIMKRKKLI